MKRTKKPRTKHRWRALFAVLFCVVLLFGGAVLGINAYVKHVGGASLIRADEAQTLTDVDCIIVLGCHVRDDGTPSDMLRDRLDQGIALYHAGVAPKLLMSGDHGQHTYNEVGTMREYALAHGVPSEDIFMDHAGFSTYETVVRAKEVFCVGRAVIVSQEYHLYRTLYLADAIGLDAYGVAADAHVYVGQTYRDIREIAARAKDFLMAIVRPAPTFLGDTIPVSGDGNVTNDAAV